MTLFFSLVLSEFILSFTGRGSAKDDRSWGSGVLCKMSSPGDHQVSVLQLHSQ